MMSTSNHGAVIQLACFWSHFYCVVHEEYDEDLKYIHPELSPHVILLDIHIFSVTPTEFKNTFYLC